MNPSDRLPLVSIIIPTYNRSRFLQETIESVLRQTYPNVEVIVVDDGSTDDTPEAMARYEGRVDYIRQPNRGVAAARNAGFHAAKGEYLCFLDDDDLFLPLKIERQMHILDRQPHVGLAHCRYYRADGQGNLLDKPGLLPEGDVLRELVRWNFVWMGAPLIRRECLERVGLFDEQVSSVTADWDMWLRIAMAGYPFDCAQEPLGVYRIHTSSMMSDVAGVEHGVIAVLDKAFSSPSLPRDVMASRPQALAFVRLWLACLYYNVRQWEDGRRNLAMALSLAPHLLSQRERLTQTLISVAMSRRIDDPLRFVADVLDHLPPVASDLRRHEPQIVHRIYLQLAMRNYGAGRLALAREQLATALDLRPDTPKRTEFLVGSLAYAALHLPVADPARYVDTVLDHLPARAQALRSIRDRTLSKVYLGLARQDHRQGARWAALRHILAAMGRHPPSTWNRQTTSFLFRVLFRTADRGPILRSPFLQSPLAHRTPSSSVPATTGAYSRGRGPSPLQSPRHPTADPP